MQSTARKVAIPVAGYSASVSLFDCGDPAAPTILALHGFTGSGDDFAQLRQALGPGRVSWICPDFMGHGNSAAPALLDPYQLPAALRLIDKARQLAPDPEKLLLLAYSMGGRLALHYLRHAAAIPALLIGASPGLRTDKERAGRRETDRQWCDLLAKSMDLFCGEWEKQPIIRPQVSIREPYRTELAARRRQNSPTGLCHSLLACGNAVLPGLWPRLGSLPPLALVHGADDVKFRDISGDMQRENERFSVHEVPGSGHSPHLEAPEALAILIREQLDSLLYR